jgi:hypothetical protein
MARHVCLWGVGGLGLIRLSWRPFFSSILETPLPHLSQARISTVLKNA